MRTLFIFPLLVAVGCYAGDTSDITSKVFQKTNQDGTVSFRMVTTYRGDAKLMKDISVYAGEKGNLRFPLDKPIPYALIRRIVKARQKENEERVSNKKRKRTTPSL